MEKNFYAFKREERLKSRKVIDKLFREGQSFGQYPLRIVWTEGNGSVDESPFQFAASVPKKRFKKASDRNRIKRLIKEAYRLHKPTFYHNFPSLEQPLAIMVIYTGTDMPAFETIHLAMKQILIRLNKKYKHFKA